MNRRAVLFWVGLVAVLLIVGMASGTRTRSGDPLDPDSTDPLGTRALMIFLDEYDVDIERGLPDENIGRALMLADRLDLGQRAEVEDWIENGGTLVVTDNGSDFIPEGVPAVETSGALQSGRCSIEGLDALTLEAASFVLYPSGADNVCFGDESVSYVQVNPVGRGRVVAVGGALPFTNEQLDEADNAVLAATLLLDPDGVIAPGGAVAGSTMAVLYEDVFTAGSRSLSDLIPSAAKWATWQLLVAFALFVVWRSSRFGRPVLEPQPVELPGSLLVRAAGELHRRSGGHREASNVLRYHLGRRLRRRLRASPELPDADLVALAADGHNFDVDILNRATAGRPAATAQELVALVAEIDQVNEAVLNEPAMTSQEQRLD